VSDTTSSSPGSGETRDAAAPIDWSTVVDDMVGYGKELLERVAERSTETASLARDRSYDADHWVKDVEWFWDNVKNDAVRAAEYWRENFPPR
jgi:hypothetical protein